MSVKDVLKGIPEKSKISINKKIEILCGLFYCTGKILLDKMIEEKCNIEIDDISKHISKIKTIKNEITAYFENVKVLGISFTYFRQCADAFKVYSRKDTSPNLTCQFIQTLSYCMDKSRFFENNIEEEFKSYDDLVGKAIKLIRKNEFLGKIATEINQKKANSYRKLSTKSADTDKFHLKEKESDRQDTKKESTDTYGMGEGEKLNVFIQKCLHKILPSRDNVIGTLKRT